MGEVDAAALRAHVGAGLARYQVPDRIAFLDAIPRNSMQKVIKRELRPLLVS